jgi:hypothetical protein
MRYRDLNAKERHKAPQERQKSATKSETVGALHIV